MIEDLQKGQEKRAIYAKKTKGEKKVIVGLPQMLIFGKYLPE